MNGQKSKVNSKSSKVECEKPNSKADRLKSEFDS